MFREGVCLRRKVIQIAGSTQLVSLPRQWAKRNNIQRGQEVEVLEDGDRIIITASSEPVLERIELDITNLGEMTGRCLRALYKRGVDEARITYKNPQLISLVQKSIANETVGFEILEQGENYCSVKYVSGEIEEFDSILRRTFLLLINMAESSVRELKNANYAALENIAILEEANNRFTIVCRRALNKYGSKSSRKVGPLYYIIEELEHIADQYKYLCQHFVKLGLKKTPPLNKDAIEMFESATRLIRVYYELFYKLDFDKVIKIKEERNKAVDEAHRLLKKQMSPADYWLIFHSLTISSEVFSMLGPYLVLSL